MAKTMVKAKGLYELIFFVTSRCNSRCRHCFNWRNLGYRDDLPIASIESLAQKFPVIDNLLLSGGEPFLRADLPELINVFADRNKIKTVSIPTNGLLGDDIIAALEKILKIPSLKAVNVNFSLDGPPEIHNSIRGVKDNYAISLATMVGVAELKKKYPKLNILVNSVIGGENQPKLLSLADSLMASSPFVEGHYFEIIRPMGPENLGKMDFGYDFYRQLTVRQYWYFKRSLKIVNPFRLLWSKFMFLGRLSFIYRSQYRNYFFKKDWPLACSAGKNIGVLSDRGLLSVCELRNKFFDLTAYNSFEELLNSPEYQNELKDLASERCFCTSSCFLNASLENRHRYKKLSLLFRGAVDFIRYEIISRYPNV